LRLNVQVIRLKHKHISYGTFSQRPNTATRDALQPVRSSSRALQQELLANQRIAPVLVDFAEDVEQEGVHVKVQGLVVQEQLAEEAQVLAEYFVNRTINLCTTPPRLTITAVDKDQHLDNDCIASAVT
jgi:hypothetical protein